MRKEINAYSRCGKKVARERSFPRSLAMSVPLPLRINIISFPIISETGTGHLAYGPSLYESLRSSADGAPTRPGVLEVIGSNPVEETRYFLCPTFVTC